MLISAITGLQILLGFIFSLHASIVSAHNPILSLLELPNVDFNPDLDPAFHCNADPRGSGSATMAVTAADPILSSVGFYDERCCAVCLQAGTTAAAAAATAAGAAGEQQQLCVLHAWPAGTGPSILQVLIDIEGPLS